jgi:hypothetical protein
MAIYLRSNDDGSRSPARGDRMLRRLRYRNGLRGPLMDDWLHGTGDEAVAVTWRTSNVRGEVSGWVKLRLRRRMLERGGCAICHKLIGRLESHKRSGLAQGSLGLR